MPYGTDSSGDYVGPGDPAKRRFDCIDCPGGYWCGVATVEPNECGVGVYSPPGQSECTMCRIGHFCNSTSTSEEMMLNNLQCPTGYFCPPGLSDVANAEDCSMAKYCPQGSNNVFISCTFVLNFVNMCPSPEKMSFWKYFPS